MAYTKYSLTPANNTAAPPDGAPEGMLPSAVNDTMRDMMSQIRDVGDGIRDGTYTMTAPKITGGSITGVTFSSSAATITGGSVTGVTFSSSAATITGGSVTGITDLAIADGGTGASTAAGARTNLGLDGFVNMKNRIINGAMTISQRDGTTAVTVNSSNSAFCPDRFNGRIQQASGAMTMQQSTTAPAGFVNSLLMTVTNTTAPASGDRVHVRQIIEGNNIADLAWGTASAKPIVLSFWVRSSITGTYGVGFINSAENRSYVGTYTVNSANTWEYKTIPVTGDTSGTWLTDNSNGIRVTFDLGSGSSYNAASANTWVAQEACRTSGCVNWQQNSGATLYITGVQLEVGSTATSFDYRPYGTELALCQRYYWTGNVIQGSVAQWGVYDGSAIVRLPVVMRSAPTATTLSNTSHSANTISGATATAGPNTGTIAATFTDLISYIVQNSAGATSVGFVTANGTGTASAEL